jgi:hypothetical protein
MNNTSKHITVPDKIIIDGHTYKPGNKALIESLPADIVREIARRQMEEIEAAYPGTFPELYAEQTPTDIAVRDAVGVEA